MCDMVLLVFRDSTISLYYTSVPEEHACHECRSALPCCRSLTETASTGIYRHIGVAMQAMAVIIQASIQSLIQSSNSYACHCRGMMSQYDRWMECTPLLRQG